METYNQILTYYKNNRKEFAPPNSALSRREEVLWRKLQTDTFPNKQILNKCTRGEITPHCPNCNGISDIGHMIWTCPSIQGRAIDPDSWEEHLLHQEDALEQGKVITIALEFAAEQGIAAFI